MTHQFEHLPLPVGEFRATPAAQRNPTPPLPLAKLFDQERDELPG